MVARIVEKISDYLEKIWKPTTAALPISASADAAQKFAPVVWVSIVVLAIGLTIYRHVARQIPEFHKRFDYVPIFLAAALIACTLLALLQLLVPKGTEKGAIAALFPSDPAEVWTAESVAAAIDNKDKGAVERFSKAGWKLQSDQYLQLITGPKFDREIFRPIITHKAVRSTQFCTDYDDDNVKMSAARFALESGVDSYIRLIAALADKKPSFDEFVNFCGAASLRSHFTQLLDSEKKRLDKERSKTSPENIAKCETDLKAKLPVREAYARATKFTITDLYVLEGENQVIDLLNRFLRSGRATNSNMPKAYEEAIGMTCGRGKKPPAPSTDQKNLEKILAALPPG